MGKSKEARKRKRANYANNRKQRVKDANLDGWKKCSEYHYQKTIRGMLVNWWPSSRKIMAGNQVFGGVYDEHDIELIIQTIEEQKHESNHAGGTPA